MNMCARCRENFTSLAEFDAHPCVMNPQGLPVLRESRRTSLVVIGPDTVRLCWPDCRNEVLLDLGIRGGRNGWVYPPLGSATVTRAWSGKTYEVAWKRCPPSSLPCDLCGQQWRYHVPALVARAADRPGPTERQRAAREAFASRYGTKAEISPLTA